MNFRRVSFLGPVILLLSLFGSAYAIYTLTVGQTVNVVAAPFTVNVTGASCSGSSVITCATGTLAINQTETLTATITFNTVTSTTFTASSSNLAIATITPTTGTITQPTISQQFTITAVAAGTTSISLTFH